MSGLSKIFITSEKGSAGVIEMSFILPMAMIIVIALLYLTFYMFLYVHLQGIAEVAADSLEKEITAGSKSISDFYLSEMSISEKSKEKVQKEFRETLDNLCVLPGMSADFSFETGFNIINPTIKVKVVCTCFKKEVFTASVERKVYFPEEFTNNLDMILDISESSGALTYIKEQVDEVKKAYEEFF